MSPATSSPTRLISAALLLFISIISLLYLFHDTVPIIKDLRILGIDSNSVRVSHETALQHDPPPEKPPYGALVIAAQPTTDTSWSAQAASK